MHPENLKNTEYIRHEAGKLTLISDEARVTISIYAPAIIRINITNRISSEDHSFAVIRQPLDESINIIESENQLECKTGELTLRISKSPLRFSFYTPDGKA